MAVRAKKRAWRSAARGAPAVKRTLRALGARIRALRTERGLTQERTAGDADLDPKHLQAIEAGRVNVTIASLVGIARALKVPLGELFLEE